jgi:hypothetical protein
MRKDKAIIKERDPLEERVENAEQISFGRARPRLLSRGLFKYIQKRAELLVGEVARRKLP